MKTDHYKQLENIIKKNLEKRGMDGIELGGELEGAAESLIQGKTIIIVTGFVIRAVMNGETDGPIGAISLAGALERLGKKVILVTDVYSEAILHSCCETMGLTCPIEIMPGHSEELFIRRLLNIYNPTHAVAIERPGRAADGRCYSMRGEDLTDIVPDTDILFKAAASQGIATIAVGDGGNEVGMGKVTPYITDSLYNGKKICAAVAADFLILSGVSNWGGHALSAALSIMAGELLLHDMDMEIKLLEGIVEAGAVDGCTKQRTATVDGLSLEDNVRVLDLLRKAAESALKESVWERGRVWNRSTHMKRDGCTIVE